MGLLRWRIGTDLDGEERRTELELRPAPEASAEELQAAAGRLERWQARYGQALNTGSGPGSATPPATAGRSAPLSASGGGAASAPRGGEPALSARLSIKFGTPLRGFGYAEEQPSTTTNALEVRNACQRTGVTRADAAGATSQLAAPNGQKQQSPRGPRRGRSSRLRRSSASGAGSVGRAVRTWCGIRRRSSHGSKAREAQRRPVLDAIAAQAAAAGA